jgi:UDP-N-acetylglucosamine--N-acetylmuramyl-(pentapeptide) pyrophosphoryl-undecaprenol N-acetylglucosamine transferase
LHSGSKIENEILKGVKKKMIISGKIHRHQMIKNIWEGIKVNLGFIESLLYLMFNRPKLIFSKGGFCSVPVLSAARLLRISYFIHESDMEMGLANKIARNKAKKVYVSFPTKYYGSDEKLIYSGLIIKNELKNTGVKNKKPTLLISGGSQGAVSIDEVAFKLIPKLIEDYIIYHQINELDEGKAKSVKRELINSNNYKYFSFSKEKMDHALMISDLIIGRAGATTIGEIAKLKKASILIPYRYAANNHQVKNVKLLERGNASIIIYEDQLDIKTLEERISYLFSDRKNLETLGKNINRLIKTNGLDVVVSEIKKFINKNS